MLATGLSCLSFAVLGVAAAAATPAGGIGTVLTPAMAAAGVGGFAGNIAANFGHEFAKSLGRRFGERYLDGWRPVDENATIVRELRQAQLKALDTLLRRFDRARRTEPDPERREQGEVFSEQLRKFLASETGNIATLTLAGAAGPEAEERQLRERALGHLPEGFDAALAIRHRPANPGEPPPVNPFRRIAEEAVLDELRRSVYADIPQMFRNAFNGGPDGAGGWFDLFIRDAAARIKQGGEFERIWNAEQDAVLRRIAADTAINVEKLAEWLPQAAAALRDFGTALDLLAGDAAAAREYAEAVYELARGDTALPLDFETRIATAGPLRFSPRNPRVPFVGRADELARLETFLASRCEPPFAWWIATGGGSGKTRLARQLCLRAHLAGWRAGFLPTGYKADITALDGWRPRHPTLIVADYALRDREAIGTLAYRLGQRGDLPLVRLLLLEREIDERFEQLFSGTEARKREAIAAARYRPEPLALGELTEAELWALVETCPWREDGAEVRVSREAFFERLRGLDQRRRALVAMILADALSLSGMAGFGGLETELKDMLRRERRSLWPPELRTDREIGAVEADVAIAFATMTDGLTPGDLTAIEQERGTPLNLDLLPACGAAIGRPLGGTARLERLEPGLIGEFFALETLVCQPNPFQPPPHHWMPVAAWRARGDKIADFVTRARQNFPTHAAIARIAITVPGVTESWLLTAIDTWAGADGIDQAFAAARDRLLGPAARDAGAARALVDIVVTATALPDGTLDPALLRELIADLAGLSEAHDEPALREAWASSVTNFIIDRATAEPDFCRYLFDELTAVRREHPDEAALREQWAKGVSTFVAHRAAAEPDFCRGLLADLAAMTGVFREEDVLLERLCVGGLFWVATRMREDEPGATEVMELLNRAAEGREPVLETVLRRFGVRAE
jgi:hypothetical protein